MVQAQQEALQATQEGGQNYMAAVDGTDASELAFTIAMKGLFRPGKDVFNVCTITDSSKDYLPFQYRPEYIEEKYQAKIYANAQSGNAKFIKKEREQGTTTKETLWNVARQYNASCIITGMHGRKGPKADFTICGSSTRYLAQQAITVAILKDHNMQPVKESYRWGVLYDGSAIADKALQKTLAMIADQDRLSTITVVEQGIDKNAIQPKIAQQCGSRAFDCIVLENTPNTTIKDRIKAYLKEQDEDDQFVDFICVGNRGLNVGNAVDGDSFMGHVAAAMIAMRQLNVIFMP